MPKRMPHRGDADWFSTHGHGQMSAGRIARLAVALTVCAVITLPATMSVLARTQGGEVELLQAAACCAPAVRMDPPVPEQALDSVAVFGDSLFVGISDRRSLGSDTLQTMLGRRSIDVWSDVRVAMTLPQGRRLLGANGGSAVAGRDVLVVGLGTNDIFNAGGFATSSWRREIDALITTTRATNPGIRIVWVDVAFERIDGRARAFNQELGSAAVTHGIEVCAWREVLVQNPQWLASDRLHLNAAGYRARRDIVLNCILEH